MVASWLHWCDQVDEVWLAPVFDHPFAKGRGLAPYDHRIAWCEALAEHLGSWCRVTRIESELPPPSYTIHTLEELAVRHPEHTFRLVAGADVASETHRWKAWDAIERSFQPIFVGRGGYPPVAGAPTFPEVSSTEIREALAAGHSVSHLVPSVVLEAVRVTGWNTGA